MGRSIAFFLQKKMEVSASNPFEMQAKLYAELTDDIFRYYSVLRALLSRVHIVRRLHSPEKKSVLIESKRPIDF